MLLSVALWAQTSKRWRCLGPACRGWARTARWALAGRGVLRQVVMTQIAGACYRVGRPSQWASLADRSGRRAVRPLSFAVIAQGGMAVTIAAALGLPPAASALGEANSTSVRSSAPVRARDGGPMRGLATWVDMYDWSETFTMGRPRLAPGAVDAMAGHGVQVLEIQASASSAPTDVLEEGLLRQWIARAHAHGIRVVAWYLPTLVDPAGDLRRLVAISRLGVEAVGVDIESESVSDPAVRSARLVQLSQAARAAIRLPLQAITMPPVVLDLVNRAFWPNFPWQGIASSYDVWTPMSYWTDRSPASGYRNGYRYSHDNTAWLRRDLGDPAAVVTLAGGIGDLTTGADVSGFLQAGAETAVVGGGIYDFRTTTDAQWAAVGALRR